MLRWIRDLISGVVILVLSIGGFIYSFDVEEGAVKNPLAGAGAYIRLWMIILALLAVILIVKSVLNRMSEKAPAVMYPLIYVTLGSIVFYVGFISVLGYTVSTILFLAILMTVYDFYPRRGSFTNKDLLAGSAKYLVVAVVMTVVVDQIFTKLLAVILPSCSLFD
jgi:hypothetical protein